MAHRKRERLRKCCAEQAVVYECERCGFREEWPLGEADLGFKSCPNFPECHDGVYSSGPRKKEPLHLSQMRVVGLGCPLHGWSAAPHRAGVAQMNIYEQA